MNFSEIKTEIKRLTGRNDSDFDDRISKAVNRAMRDWARTLPWDGLKRTVDMTHQGGRTMIFPSEVMRVMWVLDTDNTVAVEAASRQWDREEPYSLATDRTGTAEEWEPGGVSPLHTATTGPLEVFSSNASDVISLYVQGQARVSGGSGPLDDYAAGEIIVLAGTTPVTSTNGYVRVDSLCKSDDSNGLITIRALGNMVGLISQFDREPKCQVVRFLDIPSSGTVFRCGVYAEPTPLVAAYQAPHPSVDTDYLIWAACGDIHWQLREGSRATGALRKAERIAANAAGIDKMFGDYGGRVVPEDLT